MGPKPITGNPCKGMAREILTQRHGGDTWVDGHVKMGAEMGVMALQDKECHGLPASPRAWKSQRKRKHGLVDTLILDC